MRAIAAAVDLQSKMTLGNGSSIAREAQSVRRWYGGVHRVYLCMVWIRKDGVR